MALKYISALEAASLIKNGDQIGLSGFTPAGAAKATTKELAKIALVVTWLRLRPSSSVLLTQLIPISASMLT